MFATVIKSFIQLPRTILALIGVFRQNTLLDGYNKK